MSKKYLYELIVNFLHNNCSTEQFVEEIYLNYSLGTIVDLSNDEENIFAKLAMITSRFSPFTEDLQQYPNVYSDENEVKQAAEIAYDKLIELNNYKLI